MKSFINELHRYGQLLDFAFCEVDNERGLLATDKPGGSNISIKKLHSTLDYEESDIIPVQKVGRIMENLMQEAIVILCPSLRQRWSLENLPKYLRFKINVKHCTSVVPIDLILRKEHVNFDLLMDEGNVDEENDN
ncbi:unnamed protein product [Rhizophagus irregularis]|nr:unnamed protein product [Rhizophagus irregularis]